MVNQTPERELFNKTKKRIEDEEFFCTDWDLWQAARKDLLIEKVALQQKLDLIRAKVSLHNDQCDAGFGTDQYKINLGDLK